MFCVVCGGIKERADVDVIETHLFLREVTSDSFRRYTLVAENEVDVRTHDVRFVRSKHHRLNQSINQSGIAYVAELFQG